MREIVVKDQSAATHGFRSATAVPMPQHFSIGREKKYPHMEIFKKCAVAFQTLPRSDCVVNEYDKSLVCEVFRNHARVLDAEKELRVAFRRFRSGAPHAALDEMPQPVNAHNRRAVESLRERGIGVNLHYIPVHTQPYYQEMGFQADDFPQAVSYYREAISLPMFQGLTYEQQDQVIEALKLSLV